MNMALWLSLTSLALLPVAAAGSASKLENLSIGGVDYVRLEDWARVNDFQLRWTVPKQEFKLTKASGVLGFTVESAKMSLNGIHVWLSGPITLRNGAAWIAASDLATTILPVLLPPKGPSSRPIKRIVLDPGHGGKDPGYHEGSQQEKKYTLLLAKEVSDLLSKAGFKASLTRYTDIFVDLPVRPDLARRREADLFISLHFNSAGAGGSGVKGVEVFCMTPAHTSSTNSRGEGAATGAYPGNRFDAKNLLLGYQIQKAILNAVSTEDRGLRRARYEVLRTAEMPAVLIEGGFMSNPIESKHIYDSAYRRQMAQAIVDGIKAYKAVVEQ